MEIKTGGKTVLESGSVISYENNPIHFTFNELVFSFHFFDNPDLKGSKINFEQISSTSMQLNLINFNSNLGTSTTTPLELGHINDRVLILNFDVRSITKEAQKIMTYTWYLSDREEVANG